MPSTNQQLAAIFSQMADLMQILGVDSFKVIAFQRAARSLDDYPHDVAQLGPDVKALSAIPGVGKGMADRIAEFLTTGVIKDHADLLAKVPLGLPALLNVPGLGPKTVALFWNHAGVESIEDLKAKLTDGSLTKLPGMGPKKIANIQKNLEFAQSIGHRFLIGQVMPIARWFVEKLSALKQVKQVSFGGSLRRGKETIGDLDLLLAASENDALAISQAFIQLAGEAQILGQGQTKTAVRLADSSQFLPGLQIDLRIVPQESFGAALMYFTGSKDHNVAMRQRAIDRGFKLNEYGLFKDDKLVAGKTEQEVFKALGLDWIPPELREDHNEINLAQDHQLPRLIELTDVKAELHAHTIASDGKWSIAELVKAAIDRGFHTIAVTDHSVSQPLANGLTPERLEKHIQAIHAAAVQFKNQITVLAGSEVDILSDGKLDYSDSLLKQLDLVVASPHSALSQDPDKCTARLLRAIENPYVTILGHPTGRLINKRQGLSPDVKQIVAAAAQRGIALEINANSHRLDLRDSHARLAIEAGVKLAINTDAHGPADLDQLLYGVLTARRAGASPDQVINCMTNHDLLKWLESTRP